MVIGSTVAIVNGQAINLEAPPEIKEGTTFVPLRFISDVFGFEIEWIESTKTAKITRLI
jgi:N-acetylmuramoyl-L-alanine amidase